MTREVRITARARRQIVAARRWWFENRDKAPFVLDDEIDEVVALIAENPAIGVRVHARRRGVRRLTMERTRYYIYYDQVADESIEILALWHASRARKPQL